jgi:hypothetical protein
MNDISETLCNVFSELKAVQDSTSAQFRVSKSHSLPDFSTLLNQVKANTSQRMCHWMHMVSIPGSIHRCLLTVKSKPFISRLIWIVFLNG